MGSPETAGAPRRRPNPAGMEGEGAAVRKGFLQVRSELHPEEWARAGAAEEGRSVTVFMARGKEHAKEKLAEMPGGPGTSGTSCKC